MSAAAKKLTSAPPTGNRQTKRGPANRCAPIYRPDLEDAQAIDAFRHRPGESWATAHAMYDELAGVTTRIPTDKFRYHWNRRCWCWPDDLRVS